MRELYRHEQVTDGTATVRLDAETRADQPVDPKLYGKFAEHLAWNVNHGMDAQLLYNPTFGRWRFRADDPTADGGFVGSMDSDRRTAMIEEHADQRGYPGTDRLESAVADGLSFWWLRRGDRDEVTVSPDVGEHRGRAQRIEVEDATAEAPKGVMQWCYLPLQRTRTYEYEISVRARVDTSAELQLALHTVDADGDPAGDLAAAELDVGEAWRTFEGELEIPADATPDPDDTVACSITAESDCDVVVDRALLYPDDHVHRADPDVIERFREADLPLLRWPGGNFVSDYDWRDGVGPVDERPTNNNPAWGGVEPNLFGTDEFVQFCEAVGCEPLICVNAGTGTPEEAAKWVEYCNGDPEETEMGRLRAEHGHPEPYDVTYWEVGNELYGRWQPNWTTPDGNVDRYKRFREAILAADSDAKVLATGQQGEWNDRLIAEAAGELRSVTDHALVGPAIDADDDRDALYHALMGYTERLRERYADLDAQLRGAGVDDPHYAITELQLTVSETDGSDHVLSPPWRGSRHHDPAADLPGKKSVAEAVWDASVIHDAIRTEGGMELITHTGAVNHGGGLQKRRERVWADPCHYGHAMGAALFEKTPVAVDVACDTVSTDRSFGEIEPVDGLPVLDALAAVDGEEVCVMLVHRGSGVGPVETEVDLGGLSTTDEAAVTTLAGESMAAENTREDPENVVPETETVAFEDGDLSVAVPEYGLARVVADR
ncbi:MAG: alpha-L-arabinofuranosidase C-terminal domain-containing protein [Halosimplex sp.]